MKYKIYLQEIFNWIIIEKIKTEKDQGILKNLHEISKLQKNIGSFATPDWSYQITIIKDNIN